MNKLIVGLIICVITVNQALKADEPVSPPKEVFRGYDIYASTIVREDSIWKQWFAGWMTESDLPWDRIYYSFSSDSGSTWSTPVIAFTIENVQVNDPSVLRFWDQANSRYYYQMYYTYYPSGLGDPTNYIAVSTSLDGLEWTHHGVLIGADNGVDTDGAWAPSAYTADSLASVVYLYFHNNHPDGKIYRTTLTDKGLGFDNNNTITVTPAGGLRANPDVSRSPDGTWWMFYNGSSVTSGGEGNFNNCKMYSEDGISWQESGHNPIQQYDTMTTTTPHVVWTGPDTYQLWYGYGSPSFLDFDVYVQHFQSEAEPERYVVASSEALEVLAATNAVDNDPSTFWSSAGHVGSGMHTEWIYLNLGEVMEISVMELTPSVVEGATMCFPLDFRIQYSSNAIEWTDINGQDFTDYQCADTLAQTFRFDSSIPARYFRLYATKLSADSYGNFYCQIAEINISNDTTLLGIETSDHAANSEILQNYPNPFHRSTTITFSVSGTTHVNISIYDLRGNKVGEPVNGLMLAGIHTVEWNDHGAPETGQTSAYYLIGMTTNDKTLTRKMLRIR